MGTESCYQELRRDWVEESQCGYRWTTRKILVMNKMFCILITNANPLVVILCYHSMKLSLGNWVVYTGSSCVQPPTTASKTTFTSK